MPARPRLLWTILPLLSVSLLTTGCLSRMDRLDREAARLIERREALTLNEDAQGSTLPLPDTATDNLGPNTYTPRPRTQDPTADQLAVSPKPPATQPSQRPQPNFDASEPLTLDLPSVLAYALAHSPSYRSEREALLLSTLALIVERHEWGPRFFNVSNAELSGTPESGDFDTALDLVNQFTVTQRLPYGGSVAASALVNYTTFLSSATSTDDANLQSASLSANFDLPLLRNAGRVAREDLIQAERNLIYAVRDFERFRRTFLVNIANNYFDLERDMRQIENVKLQLNSLQRLADRVSARADAGFEPRFRAEDAEQQVLFGVSSLTSAEQSFFASLDRFKILIGMPVKDALELVSTQIDVPEPELDPVVAVQTAWKLRLDLQTERDQVEDVIRDVRIARNQLKADLDLTGSITIPTDDSLDRGGANFEAADGQYELGLELGLPLDREIQAASLRSALISLEAARRELRVTEDSIASQVRSSIRSIQQSSFNFGLQERNVELAQRRAQGVDLRIRRGDAGVGPRDVIEAEEDLLAARNSRDNALSILRQSVLDYLLDTGQIRVDTQGRWTAPGGLARAEIEAVTNQPAAP